MAAHRKTRRQEILAGAAVCFARKGFHQASMQDICSAAEISPGGLYRYFKGKEAIIAAIIAEDRECTAKLLRPLPDADDVREALLDLIDPAIAELDDSNKFAMHIEVLAEAIRNPTITQLVRDSYAEAARLIATALRTAQRRKQVKLRLGADAVAEVIVAQLDGLWWRKALYPDADLRRSRSALKAIIRLLVRTPNDQA